MANGDSVVLNYKANYFSFDISYLDYSDPTQKNYEYKLEGFDKQWLKSGDRQTISYSNVPAGSYHLLIRVYALGNRDVQQELVISLVIVGPFWESWWFIILCILVGVAVVGFVIYRREKLRRQHLEDLQNAREKERLDLASELHDGPLQDLYATRFLIEPIALRANANAEKLEELLQKVRSDLRMITSELQVPRFDLGFAEELRLALEIFLEKRPSIELLTDIQNEDFPLDQKIMQHLFRMFRTALGNILKHSEATIVRVAFSAKREGVSLLIEDNGVGFVMPDDLTQFVRTRHYGLFTMQSFAQGIGYTCQVRSAVGEGTTILIQSKFRSS
ncbi:MAG: triple tyrosine motif-containing protein [bacterium]